MGRTDESAGVQALREEQSALAPWSSPGFRALGLLWGLVGYRRGGQLDRQPGKRGRSLGKLLSAKVSQIVDQ